MTEILRPYLTYPLEREYESWVVHNIEHYFRELGHNADVFAVSPLIESSWPADEKILYNGKIIGLQFKQALIKNTPKKNLDYSRLTWSLRQPLGQFELIQKHEEIFYALPTFINRKWRNRALDHCIFWRPDSKIVDYNAWYNNSHARTPYKNVNRSNNAFRWGQLIEGILNCDIGKLEKQVNLRSYLSNLKQDYLSAFPDLQNKETEPDEPLEFEATRKIVKESDSPLLDSNSVSGQVLYLFHIPIPK